ncbi:MAG: hypothetical protein JNK63_08600 [Chthonomonas sp.]|nr:hypothetical protein [Chthonomonas sp.]
MAPSPDLISQAEWLKLGLSGLTGGVLALIGREWFDRRAEQRKFDRDEHLRRRELLGTISARLSECISNRHSIRGLIEVEIQSEDALEAIEEYEKLVEDGERLFDYLDDSARAYGNAVEDWTVQEWISATAFVANRAGFLTMDLTLPIQLNRHVSMMLELIQSGVEELQTFEYKMARERVRPRWFSKPKTPRSQTYILDKLNRVKYSVASQTSSKETPATVARNGSGLVVAERTEHP